MLRNAEIIRRPEYQHGNGRRLKSGRRLAGLEVSLTFHFHSIVQCGKVKAMDARETEEASF
jgi:hypothetical protein